MGGRGAPQQRLRGRRMCVTGSVGRGREEARGNPRPATGSPDSKITRGGWGRGAHTEHRGSEYPRRSLSSRVPQSRDGEGLSFVLSPHTGLGLNGAGKRILATEIPPVMYPSSSAPSVDRKVPSPGRNVEPASAHAAHALPGRATQNCGMMGRG